MSYELTPELLEYMKENAGDNLQPVIVTILALVLVIAYVSVGLRLLARWKTRSNLSYDDYSIIIGLIIVTGSNITISHSIVYGFGRHAILITDKRSFILSEIATQVLYTCSLPPIKISILCLYQRIFPSKTLYKVSMSVGLFIVAYSIVQAVCMIAQCVPIQSFWTGEPARCINFAVVLMICSVLNVATDIVILSMPIPFIWNLKIKLSKRLQLIGTFILGGIVTGISIARTVLVAQPSTADKSWVDVGPALISETELAIGVLCACLPTYRPLLRKRVSKLPKGSAAYHGTNSNGSALGDESRRWSTRRQTQMPDPNQDRYTWLRLDDVESQADSSSKEYDHSSTSVGAPSMQNNPAVHDPNQVHVRTDVRVNYGAGRQES